MHCDVYLFVFYFNSANRNMREWWIHCCGESFPQPDDHERI